jgi:hypothetical protein
MVGAVNRVIYQFGPGGDLFKAIGSGQIELPWMPAALAWASALAIAAAFEGIGG